MLAELSFCEFNLLWLKESVCNIYISDFETKLKIKVRKKIKMGGEKKEGEKCNDKIATKHLLIFRSRDQNTSKKLFHLKIQISVLALFLA